MEQLSAALVFAERIHRDQVRKGTPVPYIAHVLGVASIVLEHGGTEEEAVAALLHDAAEDAGGEAMLAEIRAQFGDEVGDIVLACSDSLAENPAERRPWLERKQEHLARLADAPPPVCLVAAADKLHNVRAVLRDYRVLGERLWPRFRGGRDGTLWYYDAVSLVLLRQLPSPLTEELRRHVERLLALAANGLKE